LEINIEMLPHYIESFGSSPLIRMDIDKLIQTNKYEFYKCAKSHELYNNEILTEGTLESEEYSKKALGIFVYYIENSDESILSEIVLLFEKAFIYCHRYIGNHFIIKFDEFVNYMIRKEGGAEKADFSYMDSAVIALEFLSNYYNKKIETTSEYYKGWLESKLFQMEARKKLLDINTQKVSFVRAPAPYLNMVNKMYDALTSMHGDLTRLMTIILNTDMNDELGFFYTFICLQQDIKFDKLFSEVKIEKSDIEGIIYSYLLEKNNDAKDCSTADLLSEAGKYIITGLYIVSFIKIYKQAKKTYFNNNKETMYLEMQQTEKELINAQKETYDYKIKEKAYLDQIEKLERENKRLKTTVKEQDEESKELIALRNYIYSQESNEIVYVQNKLKEEDIALVNAVIVGGSNSWQNKLRERMPKYKYIPSDSFNFDEGIIKKCEYVFVNTDYLSHKMYYKVISGLSDRNNLFYLPGNNIDNAITYIYKAITEPPKKR